MKWEKLLRMLQNPDVCSVSGRESKSGEKSVQSQGRGNPFDLQVLTLDHPKAIRHPGGGPHTDAIAKLKQHIAGFQQCMEHNSWRDKEQAPIGRRSIVSCV